MLEINANTLHKDLKTISYLKLPSGGVAYGTPKNASTGGWVCTITPLNGPYLVLTTLVLYLCTTNDPSLCPVHTHIVNNKITTFEIRALNTTWLVTWPHACMTSTRLTGTNSRTSLLHRCLCKRKGFVRVNDGFVGFDSWIVEFTLNWCIVPA